MKGCFISWFYIKPQPRSRASVCSMVASYLDSTSNHNISTTLSQSIVLLHILILHQTTTNYNYTRSMVKLLHILILHQTTTIGRTTCTWRELLHILILHQTTTIGWRFLCELKLLHILILHQTTTKIPHPLCPSRCFISWFYIKPQPVLFKILNISMLYEYFHTRSGSNISALLQIY